MRDARASDVAGAVAGSFLRGRRSLPSCGDRLAPLLRGTDTGKAHGQLYGWGPGSSAGPPALGACPQSLLRVTTDLARFALACIPNVAPRQLARQAADWEGGLIISKADPRTRDEQGISPHACWPCSGR